MASVSERHAGGRPQKHERSELFNQIERWARRRGMHLDELAERAGVGVATIYQISDPKLSTAKAIAAALGITIDRMISTPRRSTRQTA